MIRRIAGYVVAALVGLGVYWVIAQPAILGGVWAAGQKLRGKAGLCDWERIATFYQRLERFDAEYTRYKRDLQVKEFDQKLGIERVGLPGDRDFWVVRATGPVRGFAWLLAEHSWMEWSNPDDHVKAGDVVLDCGAHVGVFTSHALRRGARKVVAIEPDPRNQECLRRNFQKEIAGGQVVIAPVAVWSKEGEITLFLGSGTNTGMNSVVVHEDGGKVTVRGTTVDRLVKELQLDRVDFIKMDIEGAEREALKGAQETLKQWRPRLMMDLNHREDDAVELPKVVRAAQPDYRLICGPCQQHETRQDELIPHVVFFR